MPIGNEIQGENLPRFSVWLLDVKSGQRVKRLDNFPLEQQAKDYVAFKRPPDQRWAVYDRRTIILDRP